MALTTLPPVWIMSLNRLFFFWRLPPIDPFPYLLFFRPYKKKGMQSCDINSYSLPEIHYKKGDREKFRNMKQKLEKSNPLTRKDKIIKTFYEVKRNLDIVCVIK